MHFYHAHIFQGGTQEGGPDTLDMENILNQYQDRVFDYYQINHNVGEGIIHLNPENADKVWKIINQKIDRTKQEFELAKRSVIQNMVSTKITSFSEIKMNDFPKNMSLGFALERVGRLLTNEFCISSYFYDWVISSSDMNQERLQQYIKDGDKFLVLIDFHN